VSDIEKYFFNDHVTALSGTASLFVT